MEFIANYTVKDGYHILTFDSKPPLLQKLNVYEFTYAKAVEAAERLIGELIMSTDVVVKVVLID